MMASSPHRQLRPADPAGERAEGGVLIIDAHLDVALSRQASTPSQCEER